MKPSALMQHPPAMILSLALLLLPAVTTNTSRSTEVVSSQQVSVPIASSAPASGEAIASNRESSSGQPTVPDDASSDASPADGTTNEVGIDFGLGPLQAIRQSFGLFNRPAEPKNPSRSYDLHHLFEGNSHSLVAKAVGAAEGTRTPSGGYTSAFQGHVDPGNGVWNLGTFSYQHGAASPEEADRKQLQRLQRQATQIRQRASRAGISLGLEEELNGIDLANQSPLAALGEPGYAEWLAEAYDKGYRGKDAILWARVMGYWDVRRGRWNAPGLGNTEPSIRRDQSRRMEAIAQAIEHGTASQPQQIAGEEAHPMASSAQRAESPAVDTPDLPASPQSAPEQPSGQTTEADGSLNFGL